MSNNNSNNSNSVHFRYDISDLLNLKDKDEKDVKCEELRIRTEENIKMLKEQIFQLMEMSFKTKNQIELLLKSQKDLSEIRETPNESAFSLVEEKVRSLQVETESYKKITNERIEKIFKLLMMTHEKLNIDLTK